MRIDILTLFPEMCETVLDESIIGRARQKGLVTLCCHDIRDYAGNKHRRVDDTPYGGGKGMILQAEPIARCLEAIGRETGEKPYCIYLSPQGAVLSQARARAFALRPRLALLCGHYEGVDERVLEELVDEEISIGDYVLTGGELPALVLADCVCRMLPGVLAEDECFMEESHYNGLLEYPQYTKPPVWRGREVPEVLLSGHHARVSAWREEESRKRTAQKRPDLMQHSLEQKAGAGNTME